MLWLSFLLPFGAFCAPFKSNSPPVTHFALIVPLPSRKECQRLVFLEFDSDILPPFLLTLQTHLSWQEWGNITHKANQLWTLITEPPGVTGSVKLISQCEDRVDYIPNKDWLYITFKIVFECLPLVLCKRKEIPLTFSMTAYFLAEYLFSTLQ